ncbi:MAG: FAD-binding oxidoreductase [Acidaminococcus sp.]|jgi:glycolate oxidase|nr:FAD-binding oxidoreductase [Acidaminococcus sp.]MCI2100538.1 FAD-binding oxidoreductase [Acidaminococcus sp.]MCI2114859.1 FAD-binding oxidoreductase [Acidaminococcus sp.]MCI2117347.1 FAD-binding oxidoreductase [Acidaminococcus sp.]
MTEYNPITPDFLQKLFDIAGRRVVVGESINPDYTHDTMPIYGIGMPEATIDVNSTEEIAAIMKLCNEHHVPVTVRGSGTGLAGGCTPVQGGVVLCTVRMNKILGYDEKNMNVRVQPGVLLDDLARDAAAHGFFYPPDPGEKYATLGGNVSTNAGGMRAVKYGTTRDYVLAMTVVLPTGEIVRLGAPVSKTSSGYSLLHLMIGSEGTLGIITELTLKLITPPKCHCSLIVPFRTLSEAIQTVPPLKRSGLDPQAIEFFEKEMLDTTEAYIGTSVFPKQVEGETVGAYLLVTLDASTNDLLDQAVEDASELFLGANAMDVLVADVPMYLDKTWAARSAFLEGLENQYNLIDECDVVVPVSHIPDFILHIHEIRDNYPFDVRMFGHAGDGNIHVYACANGEQKDIMPFKEATARFMDDLYAKALELDGQISGEHGIGFGKAPYLQKALEPAQIRIMQGIKEVFDPNLILNPNKICF